MCKEFSTLPYAGGMLDQPFRLAAVFEIIQNAVYEKQELDSKKSEAKGARKRA
jgi:hypothetical protein